MRSWLQDLINFIYPPVCHICDTPLASHEKFLCTHCVTTLPRTGYHRNPHNPLEQRLAGQFPFVAATGHFFYSKDSALSELIQDMKYRGFHSIGNYLGELAARELYTSGFLSEIDYIVPLPMHFLKKAKRGYNQTEKIAAGISKATGIKVANALKMIRQRKTQTALSSIQRLNNANNLFRAKKDPDLSGKGVLLVDDICTTGATIGAAGNALAKAFPTSRIYLFTIGVTF